MKVIKIAILLLAVTFLQCATHPKLQVDVPFEIGQVYYQEDQLGVNLYIPIKSNPNNIKLDSVHFKGQQTKLESKNDTLFIANFNSIFSQKRNIIMSNEPYAEYGNQVPKLPARSPLKLKDTECVITYKKDATLKYFKISNINKRIF